MNIISAISRIVGRIFWFPVCGGKYPYSGGGFTRCEIHEKLLPPFPPLDGALPIDMSELGIMDGLLGLD